MISLQSETIQAVLFHDRTSDAACAALKAFLQRILHRFAQVFEHELEQLQPQLQASATPTAEEVRWVCFAYCFSDEGLIVLSRCLICSAKRSRLRSGGSRRSWRLS
jgi:hypothetical protein